MSGHSSHYVAAGQTGSTRAELEAGISGKMRPDALFGESRAEEPGFGPGEESFRVSRWAEARPRPPAGTFPEGHDVGHVF